MKGLLLILILVPLISSAVYAQSECPEFDVTKAGYDGCYDLYAGYLDTECQVMECYIDYYDEAGNWLGTLYDDFVGEELMVSDFYAFDDTAYCIYDPAAVDQVCCETTIAEVTDDTGFVYEEYVEVCTNSDGKIADPWASPYDPLFELENEILVKEILYTALNTGTRVEVQGHTDDRGKESWEKGCPPPPWAAAWENANEEHSAIFYKCGDPEKRKVACNQDQRKQVSEIHDKMAGVVPLKTQDSAQKASFLNIMDSFESSLIKGATETLALNQIEVAKTGLSKINVAPHDLASQLTKNEVAMELNKLQIFAKKCQSAPVKATKRIDRERTVNVKDLLTKRAIRAKLIKNLSLEVKGEKQYNLALSEKRAMAVKLADAKVVSYEIAEALIKL